jgi:hypothetical protein
VGSAVRTRRGPDHSNQGLSAPSYSYSYVHLTIQFFAEKRDLRDDSRPVIFADDCSNSSFHKFLSFHLRSMLAVCGPISSKARTATNDYSPDIGGVEHAALWVAARESLPRPLRHQELRLTVGRATRRHRNSTNESYDAGSKRRTSRPALLPAPDPTTSRDARMAIDVLRRYQRRRLSPPS